MATSFNVPHFEKFYVHETTTIATRWRKYKQRYESLCTTLEVEEDARKLALLLHYVGEEVFHIYINLEVPGQDKKYENVIVNVNNVAIVVVSWTSNFQSVVLR